MLCALRLKVLASTEMRKIVVLIIEMQTETREIFETNIFVLRFVKL